MSIMDRYDAIKEWCDGYRFSNLDIYCPWDVISYCHALRMTPSVKPQNYWVNTSSNNIIKQFAGRATSAARNELELLLKGCSIKKRHKSICLCAVSPYLSLKYCIIPICIAHATLFWYSSVHNFSASSQLERNPHSTITVGVGVFFSI